MTAGSGDVVGGSASLSAGQGSTSDGGAAVLGTFAGASDSLATLADTSKMQFNPEVTVRARGVMEKCTFCIQRTRKGRYPACVEICMAGALTYALLGALAQPLAVA